MISPDKEGKVSCCDVKELRRGRANAVGCKNCGSTPIMRWERGGGGDKREVALVRYMELRPTLDAMKMNVGSMCVRWYTSDEMDYSP